MSGFECIRALRSKLVYLGLFTVLSECTAATGRMRIREELEKKQKTAVA